MQKNSRYGSAPEMGHIYFEILLRKTGLKVPVKVRRIIAKGHACRGMGIELVEKSSNYIKLVDNFRS